MDELPIGRRVAYWRGRRKMSQQVFADRLGKSKSWVDKVERGVRRLDKFSVIYEIADVLQVDVQLLLGKDPERRPDTVNCIDQVEVEEIRSALERYNQISAFFAATPQAPPLGEMRKAVSHAWLTFQHAKYGVLARALPKLLRDGQALDTSTPDTDRPEPPTCSGRCTRSPRPHCASWASTSCPGWRRTGPSRCASVPTTRCWPASRRTVSAVRSWLWAAPGPRWRST